MTDVILKLLLYTIFITFNGNTNNFNHKIKAATYWIIEEKEYKEIATLLLFLTKVQNIPSYVFSIAFKMIYLLLIEIYITHWCNIDISMY